METLDRVDIYTALNKPNLVFGADRELVLTTGVFCAALIFTGLTVITTIIGLFLLMFCTFFLRLMAKTDPIMRHIFIRQIKYRQFYFARSTPFIRQ